VGGSPAPPEGANETLGSGHLAQPAQDHIDREPVDLPNPAGAAGLQHQHTVTAAASRAVLSTANWVPTPVSTKVLTSLSRNKRSANACVVASPQQSVEAPVVGVYRENLYLAEARLASVPTKHRGTHDGAGCCCLRISHGAG